MADKKQETIEDVVRKIRNEIAELRKVSPNVPSVAADWWEARADEIEAAHRREVATAEKSSVVGNAAKLREALELVAKSPLPSRRIKSSSAGCGVIIYEPEPEDEWLALLRYFAETAKSALSAPPRNCDRYAGYQTAYKAWQRTKKPYAHKPDGYDFAVWLFATAKEEGGAK